MQSATLPPIEHRDEYTALLAIPAIAYLTDVVFTPLHESILVYPAYHDDSPAASIIYSALLSGDLEYRDGSFVGRFDSTISKALRSVGATLGPRLSFRGVFNLPEEKMPVEVRQAIARAKLERERDWKGVTALVAALLAGLQDIKYNKTGIYLPALLRRLVDSLNNESGQNVHLDSEEISERVEEAIKQAAVEIVQKIQKRLEAEEDVPGTKTVQEILAEQETKARTAMTRAMEYETALTISAFRKAVAKAVGSRGYIWETRRDERVRHDHAVLQSRFFTWDEPPITDTATGRRCHPGEDYNCRCSCQIVVD